ncbi:MAG: exopolysaccharide biosynthesis polyprenyl glycosylphosphotransferase [Bacteroidales bacterium]|nr:exopolysaccharide biosynthesis polyprenyl glycosylphosphotransferase [Bacteroidales bacterium]
MKILIIPQDEENFDKSQFENLQFILLKDNNYYLDVDGIVIPPFNRMTSEWTQQISHYTLKKIPFFNVCDIYENFIGKIPLKYFNIESLENYDKSFYYNFFKRCIDISIIFIISPFVFIFTLFISAIIKIDSDGPVFFLQERVGQGGKIFKILKFRTMYKNAEENGAKFADKNDARITRVGNFLRKLRLDELPQIWNVLKGEMSLIGPRPEQVEFVKEFEKRIPFYSIRHLIKPGITGWAQVHLGYASNIEETSEKLEYDLYYIKNMSLWLDVVVILKTILIIIKKKGAR